LKNFTPKSNQELYTLWLLEEFKSRRIIESFDYEPESFLLSESQSIESQKRDKKDRLKTRKTSLIREHSYTCDFVVYWNPVFKGTIFSDITLLEEVPFFIAHNIDGKYVTYLEVKPDFDYNNMTRLFVVNQKWVYDKYKIYIQLFKPEQFFVKYFIPIRYLRTDKDTKLRDIKFYYLTFPKWFKIVKPQESTSNEEII
jgi:hypothetical protein